MAGLLPAISLRWARCLMSFRDGPQGRTRNPGARTSSVSGFRVRRFAAPRNDCVQDHRGNSLNAPGLTHGHFNNDHARRMIKDLWYKNAVFYCLSVGTYMDSNADGIGDFQGLMRRLDYLSGLGITAIWLMPFQKSPGKDDGYDICDYYNVNPAFGSLGDFVEFTHARRSAASA